MMAFTVHPGGKDGNEPPAPARRRRPRRTVRDLTAEQIATLIRDLVNAAARRPELYGFLQDLVFRTRMDATQDRYQFDVLEDLITGRWRDDHRLTDVLTRWHALRATQRDAVSQIARHADEPLTAIRNATHAVLPTLTPQDAATLAAFVTAHAARVNSRQAPARLSPDAREARIATIVNALPHMTDEQIAGLAPLAAALIDATDAREPRTVTAVRKLLRIVFSRDGWAHLATYAVSVLLHNRHDEDGGA